MTAEITERRTALSLSASPDEVEWLQQWGQGRHYTTVVICGAGDGSLTLALLALKNYMRLYIAEPDEQRAIGLVRRVSEAGYDPQTTIRVYHGAPDSYASRYDGGAVDLLILDMDTQWLEPVRATLAAWSPRLVQGGILFAREFAAEPNLRGARAVICADWPDVATIGLTQVLRKI